MERPGSSSETVSYLEVLIEEGRVEELERYLSQHPGCINVPCDYFDNTPLHLADESGRAECVQLLLNLGARTDVKNADSDTPLHLAAMLKSSECLKILLEAEDIIWQKNMFKCTPLHHAARAGCADSVKLLIEYISRTESLNIEDEVNKPGLCGWTPLYLSAMSGSLDCVKLLVANKSALSVADEFGDTPLHYAAMLGSPDIVKYLILRGADLLLENKDKLRALDMVLKHVQAGEDLMKEAFDECVRRTDSGDVEISLKILCPGNKNRMAVANTLYTCYKHKKELLLHPLLASFILFEWRKSRKFIWYRFLVYLLYLLVLTIFVSLSPNEKARAPFRAITGLLSVHVILFCLLYLLSSQYTWYERVYKILLTAGPPILTLVSVCIPYNSEWCGLAILFSWLFAPLYFSTIQIISQQMEMFRFVTKEIFKHSLALSFVLFGFSITFFVLYRDTDDNFRNLWYSFLYTTLVLLQGEDIGNFAYGGNGTANSTHGEWYTPSFTENIMHMGFAGITASLLFVFLVIIALLNILLALAVKGGDELKEYGKVYHLWCEVQLLYDWHEVKRFFRKDYSKRTCNDFRHQDSFLVGEGDVPMSLLHELRTVAVYKGRKKGLELKMDKMAEDLSKFIIEMKSLTKELKKE